MSEEAAGRDDHKATIRHAQRVVVALLLWGAVILVLAFWTFTGGGSDCPHLFFKINLSPFIKNPIIRVLL